MNKLRKKRSNVNSLLSCFRNVELLSKSKMGKLTMRPLEAKSLGLELPMLKKSTSGTEMNKEQFMETGWIGQNS